MKYLEFLDYDAEEPYRANVIGCISATLLLVLMIPPLFLVDDPELRGCIIWFMVSFGIPGLIISLHELSTWRK